MAFFAVFSNPFRPMQRILVSCCVLTCCAFAACSSGLQSVQADKAAVAQCFPHSKDAESSLNTVDLDVLRKVLASLEKDEELLRIEWLCRHADDALSVAFVRVRIERNAPISAAGGEPFRFLGTGSGDSPGEDCDDGALHESPPDLSEADGCPVTQADLDELALLADPCQGKPAHELWVLDLTQGRPPLRLVDEGCGELAMALTPLDERVLRVELGWGGQASSALSLELTAWRATPEGLP
jgi:hypothetical protein